jgi:very-short-patch-repair endonuclease
MAPRGGGASNPQEAAAVVAALRDLLVTRGYTGSVGVVTPFRAQVASLQRAVAEDPQLTAAAARAELLVDTVHKFQGDERDVMFFSPVVAEGMPQGGLSFLRANGNLFNVAITRARGLLHVVGDRAAASNCGIDYLASFSQHVELVATARRKQDDGQPDEEDLGGRYPTVSNPERVSEWEHRLYEALYRAGLRPVPQFSVEQYDLDFALFDGDRRLNIEVDGEKYHRSWTGELCHRDQLRNQRLIELGWEVKRFWVPEIRDRLEDCVAAIKKWQGEPTA